MNHRFARISASAFLLILFTSIFGFLATPKKEPVIHHREWNSYFYSDLLPAMPIANGFDFPLPPSAKMEKAFLQDQSLGEIWTIPNLTGEGTVLASGEGLVTFAANLEGEWGCVVIITHRLPPKSEFPAVETLYSGMQGLSVEKGTFVHRGDKIGFLKNGTEPSRLRWEMRTKIGLLLGPQTWDGQMEGWIGPSDFVLEHRGK